MTEHDRSRDTGLAVRRARTLRSVSLRELARRISVSPATMSAIETGTTPLTVARLFQIGEALAVSVIELIGDEAAPGESRVEDAGSACAAPGGNPSRWRIFEPLEPGPVMAAAIQAFVRWGYHGATVRMIARSAGMSVPGVYHHYASKQELLVAVLNLTMSELRWRLIAAREEGHTPRERFALMVEALALFHTHRRDLAFVGASEMRSLEPGDHTHIASRRNEIQYALDEQVSLAIADGSFRTAHPHDAGRAVATMCTSLPQWFSAAGPSSPENIATEYAQFALDMMRSGAGMDDGPGRGDNAS
jgi:AcrR family transcriptional regulator/DNA-binding XRE family transcriptional regulator